MVKIPTSELDLIARSIEHGLLAFRVKNEELAVDISRDVCHSTGARGKFHWKMYDLSSKPERLMLTGAEDDFGSCLRVADAILEEKVA